MTEHERLDRITELRERGDTYEQIGEAIGTSPGNVGWICLKYGIDGPRTRKLAARNPSVVKRGDREVRGFTPEEDAEINRLALQGLKQVQIARALNRRPSSILARQRTLARQEERALEGAA